VLALYVMSKSKHASKKEYNDDNPWRSEDVLVELYHEKDMTLKEIGSKFDVSHQAILYWFDKHDIESRDVPDSFKNNGVGDSVYNRDDSRKTPKRQMMFCANCGEEIVVELCQVGNRRYCSQDCAKENYSKSNHEKVNKRCEYCNEPFKALPRRKYCSRKCYWDDIDKGGRPVAEKYRQMERERGWTKRVYERDDYTCQRCGDRGGDLQAHHKTPVAEIAKEVEDRESIRNHELFDDITNGVTLCTDCHKKVHYGDSNE